MRRVSITVVRIGGIGPELVILDEVPENIDAKPVDALAQPEAHDVVDGVANLRVPPIEVRLRREKRVVIVLAGCVVVGPCASAEFRKPVGGSAASRRGITPNVPIALRTGPRR